MNAAGSVPARAAAASMVRPTTSSRPASIEPLTLHVAVVGIAILIGYLILTALQWVEQALWADTVELLAFVPLFPLAMLGGVVVQLVMDWRGIGHLLDHQMMLRIQGLALDFLILAAIATLSLTAIAANWEVFLVLSVAGVVFCTGFLLLFVPKVIPDYWLERGIADFGQSMGVTATGLILMRIADPHDESPAMEAFGYKQLFFEPFFGGGLITAASVPLIYQFGPWPLLVVMSVLFVVAVQAHAPRSPPKPIKMNAAATRPGLRLSLGGGASGGPAGPPARAPGRRSPAPPRSGRGRRW